MARRAALKAVVPEGTGGSIPSLSANDFKRPQVRTWKVKSTILHWIYSTATPEEAHALAKQNASNQFRINKSSPRPWVPKDVFKEISRILRGNFEMELCEPSPVKPYSCGIKR